MRKTVIAAAASVLFAAAAHAQTAAPTTPAPAPPPQYGQPGVTLEQATAAVVAAAAEAKKNGWFLGHRGSVEQRPACSFQQDGPDPVRLDSDCNPQGRGRCPFPSADQGLRGSHRAGWRRHRRDDARRHHRLRGRHSADARWQDHRRPSAAAAQPVSRTASPARPGRTRSNRFAIPRELQGRGGSVAALCFSVPPVADQRLFLPPDQDEDRTEDTEHQPGRRCEHIG